MPPITPAAWTAAEGWYARIIDMPFIRELIAGDLRPEAFEFYILQDSLYLQTYAEVLAIMGARSRDRDICQMFCRHAAEAVEVERALHAGFIGSFETHRPGIPQSKACRAYCDFLLAAAYHLPYPGALGAVLPCYWVYREVGNHVLKAAGKLDDHPYRAWIETYADEAFAEVVQDVMDVCDRLAPDWTDADRAMFIEQYVIGTELEYDFWQSAYELG